MKKSRPRADDRFKRSMIDTILDGVFRPEPLRAAPPHALAAPPRGASAAWSWSRSNRAC